MDRTLTGIWIKYNSKRKTDALFASTYGTGILIKDALEKEGAMK